MIDFAMTSDQRALADAAAALMRRHADTGSPDASPDTWRALADFGALTLLTKHGGGDTRDLVALMGALGSTLCPGPVVATVAAAPLLSDQEARRLASGQLRVTVAVSGHVPWPDTADVVLEVDGDALWRVAWEREGPLDRTVSGEPWARARIRRGDRLPGGTGFIVAAELGLAAAVLGMARTMLDRGAAHARTRVQFGRPIGAFQGVAHPLAGSWAEVTAAEELVRLAATEVAGGRPSTARARLIRAEAASAALRTAYVVHQVMGGMSFASESGVGTISSRVRQWSLLLPDVLGVAGDRP
jgi:alkylation response protein AidB-like acyl-CoA dehydrogenase